MLDDNADFDADVSDAGDADEMDHAEKELPLGFDVVRQLLVSKVCYELAHYRPNWTFCD